MGPVHPWASVDTEFLKYGQTQEQNVQSWDVAQWVDHLPSMLEYKHRITNYGQWIPVFSVFWVIDTHKHRTQIYGYPWLQGEFEALF